MKRRYIPPRITIIALRLHGLLAGSGIPESGHNISPRPKRARYDFSSPVEERSYFSAEDCPWNEE